MEGNRTRPGMPAMSIVTAEQFYLLLAEGLDFCPNPRFFICASASARDGVNLDKAEKLSQRIHRAEMHILQTWIIN